MDHPQIEQELQELRRRVASLEEMIFRKHRARRCMERIVQAWPGPFTVQQIDKALAEFHPEIHRELAPYAVSSFVNSLLRASVITRLTDGAGQVAALFERIGEVPDCTRRTGRKFNRRAAYESGFRHIVRSALDDLPAEFTLQDLREWMEKQMPHARIPYGSWSSTLYKLTQSGELICVKGRGSNCSARRKVWKRGPRKVAPSGEEVRELEAAWARFRSSMKTENPVLPSP